MMKVSDLTEDEEKIIMSAKRYAKDHYDTEAYRKNGTLVLSDVFC